MKPATPIPPAIDPLVETIGTPSIVTLLNWADNPRTTTLSASPFVLPSDTPGSRPIDSAKFASGNSFILSAETILTILLDDNCSFIADNCPWAWALTSIVRPSILSADN